jgi:hypothetical protein
MLYENHDLIRDDVSKWYDKLFNWKQINNLNFYNMFEFKIFNRII